MKTASRQATGKASPAGAPAAGTGNGSESAAATTRQFEETQRLARQFQDAQAGQQAYNQSVYPQVVSSRQARKVCAKLHAPTLIPLPPARAGQKEFKRAAGANAQQLIPLAAALQSAASKSGAPQLAAIGQTYGQLTQMYLQASSKPEMSAARRRALVRNVAAATSGLRQQAAALGAPACAPRRRR